MHEESHEMDASYDDNDRQNRFGGRQPQNIITQSLQEMDAEHNDTYQANDTYQDIDDDDDDDNDGMNDSEEEDSPNYHGKRGNRDSMHQVSMIQYFD